MKTSETVIEINKALAALRKDIKQPTKSKTVKVKTRTGGTYSYSYVPLERVVEIVDEIGAKHGLSHLQEAYSTEDGSPAVVTRLMHTSGEWIETRPLILPAEVNDAQSQGSAITYARRYQLSAIYGIAAEDDDDGQQAVRKPDAKRQTSRTKCSKCKHEIIAMGGATADQIIEKSVAKFGKPVCVPCWNAIEKEEAETALPEKLPNERNEQIGSILEDMGDLPFEELK